MMVDEEYLNLFDKLETKVCGTCKKNKLLTEFHKDCTRFDGIDPYCTVCRKEIRIKYKKEKPFHYRCDTVRSKTSTGKLPFNLTGEYLESIWTDTCPILGVELDLFAYNKNADNAAQVDRIVPDKGYVKGNVGWLSFRANRLKGDATAKEHMKIAQWMLGQLNDG